MDRWVYIHIQFIIWSFYLFTLHLSRKDHMVMKILLFVWFLSLDFISGADLFQILQEGYSSLSLHMR